MSLRNHILSFLRDPQAFSGATSDADTWMDGLETVAEPAIAAGADHPLRPAQIAAWRGLATARAGLVLGPPGTGKTHLLSWLILGYIHARRAAGLPARVFVSAFTRNAIGNVLDGVAARARKADLDSFATHFLGNPPAGGLSPLVRPRPSTTAAELNQALEDLTPESVVMGASVWTLYKLLSRPNSGTADGFTAGLFDLVCIDEASQLVLGQGLMALGGLKEGGRLIVAGDDKQLPPIRAGRSVTLENRALGGSLYSFLKSAQVPEFALEETFRLNAPLAAFPERKFYPGRYRSAPEVATQRLELKETWRDGLENWETACLDPDHPIVVVLHDGPLAASSNAFEAAVAARLAGHLARLMPGDEPGLWRERLAIVSPHRAQNSAIRDALTAPMQAVAFVETVDRIQGKERDAIILSYSVADAEFAVAEADFIFAPERLNVAITRARSKLIVLVSRRLLDAVPTEQEQMDKAELLREFAFDAVLLAEAALPDGAGGRFPAQIRVMGFDGAPPLQAVDAPIGAGPTPAVTLTAWQDSVLQAVRSVSLGSDYGNATLPKLQMALATRDNLLPVLSELHGLGRIALELRSSRNGPFWVALPLDPPRCVHPATQEIVRRFAEEAIRQSRSGSSGALYDIVRKHFAWMDGSGEDVLRPHFDQLRDEGLLAYKSAKGHLLIDWVDQDDAPETAPEESAPDLSDTDFQVLNALEDLEVERINFGIVEAWTSSVGVANAAGLPRVTVTASLARLEAAGWLLIADEGRIRSRMAELARETRYLKQRFRRDGAEKSPYLVRSLKVLVRDRDKPERKRHKLLKTFSDIAERVDPVHAAALRSLSTALARQWSVEACLAGFQARSLDALSRAWNGDGPDAFVIAADTGSGKTEAAGLPLIAAAAADRLRGIRGVRAILAYPRVRLAANQAQRLAKYLAALAMEPGMPTITLGLQVGAVPETFDRLQEWETKAGWAAVGSGTFSFPFFACPDCGEPLLLGEAAGVDGADKLFCTSCRWSFGGWIGSKAGLRRAPPALFLPTTDSLHQWMHDTRYGRLFGDELGFAPPRALLADEIHLYAHVHGAQVGLALRRLAARCERNADGGGRMLAIGMSATLGDPVSAWGRLMHRDTVSLLTPMREEREPNPRGREYFYFIQPEVESRGQDIAGASTTIQALMCLAHGMRRRTGREGGFRSLVFLDSIDKVRRLHAAFDDAETHRRLAAYRTRKYPDDPLTGAPRDACCGEPHGCDAFRDGECWIFAAQDKAQQSVRGRRCAGAPLRVAEQPVHAGAVGSIEAQIKEADIIFATSSLEVGYDDPDITLVYQHYAPRNLASFIQRKGRGGRGENDRPITAVTLSIYSSRDSWWFRKPDQMISPAGFGIPLNPDNHFVRRGQMLAAILDAFARHQTRTGTALDPRQPSAAALQDAASFVESIFGPEPWREFGRDSLEALWQWAMGRARRGMPLRFLSDVRNAIDLIPDLLFDVINLPQLRVRSGPDLDKPEDISLALPLAAPGNATRRYDATEVHWRPPVQGKGPWFADQDYETGQWATIGDDGAAWLNHLPEEARPLLSGLSPRYFRPKQLSFDRLGLLFGVSWHSHWAVPAPSAAPQAADTTTPKARLVRHDSRGSLRGFPLIKVDAARGRSLEVPAMRPWVTSLDVYLGDGREDKTTGLVLARVYWGADAEVRLEGPKAEPETYSQIFTGPDGDQPLLHGYHVQTEGIRLTLDGQRLDRFVAAEVERLNDDAGQGSWYAAQMLRYLVESKAQTAGVSLYEARRGAELIVGATSDPDLKARLNRLLAFWDAAGLAALFEDTRASLLSQHPLLSADRVTRVAAALSGQSFQLLLRTAVQAVVEPIQFRRFLKTAVLHALAVRMKESFCQTALGDERQVILHVRLPMQFGDDADPTITICEVGAFGDGTTRTFVDRLETAAQHWHDGFLADCPNAREDEVLRRFLERKTEHAAWRAIDPDDRDALTRLAHELGLPPGVPVPAAVLRLLFGTEAVGDERFDLYDLAMEVQQADERLTARLGRAPSAWELVSAAVSHAKGSPGSLAHRVLHAYGHIEDAALDESLSPEARLADQIYRLHARLCVDGCQACVHQPSDLMSETLAEASTSRSLLERFLLQS